MASLPALANFQKNMEINCLRDIVNRLPPPSNSVGVLLPPNANFYCKTCRFLLQNRYPEACFEKSWDIRRKNFSKTLSDDNISFLASNLSLLECDGDNDPWAHRLICGFAQSTVDDEGPFIDGIIKTFEEELEVTKESDWKGFRELLKIVPHAEHIISLEAIPLTNKMNIADGIRKYYQNNGNYQLAKRYGLIALESSQLEYEPGHPSIARSQSNLGLALRELGELEGARDLSRKALESDQLSFEPGHPSIANSQSNLAIVLLTMGDLEGARDLLSQSLKSDQNSFVPGHPEIALKQSNLAMVLQNLGDLEGARDLLHQALESGQLNLRTQPPHHCHQAIQPSYSAPCSGRSGSSPRSVASSPGIGSE